MVRAKPQTPPRLLRDVTRLVALAHPLEEEANKV
jgi:hypothetical protein